ncbi:MAG: GNAT family protein [Planctomycetota bacterium]|nr:GNAT family protein [Planctomycetota bacterium]
MSDEATQHAGNGRADALEVFIRTPRLEDRAEFLAIRARDRAWLMPWEPLPAKPGVDLFTPGEFEKYVADSTSERRVRFFICVRESGSANAHDEHGVIAGQASLSEIIRGPLQQAFLGYWVAQPFAGRGVMSRGLRLVLAEAFGTLGLHRVEANIQPHNARSIALVRRLGFRLEGYSPQYLQIQGAWADHERWALRADEFEAAAGSSRA